MKRKVIAAILAVYGFFMLGGGIVADAFGVPPTAQIGMGAAGVFLLASGVGMWRQRRWAVVLAIVGLIAVSGAVYYTDYVTNGPGGIRPLDHVLRGLLGLVLIVLMVRCWKTLK